MDVLGICQSYGLELVHSDSHYTRVEFKGENGKLYNFDFATHMLQGDQGLLSKRIINTIITLSSESARHSIQLELQGLLGL